MHLLLHGEAQLCYLGLIVAFHWDGRDRSAVLAEDHLEDDGLDDVVNVVFERVLGRLVELRGFLKCHLEGSEGSFSRLVHVVFLPCASLNVVSQHANHCPG